MSVCLSVCMYVSIFASMSVCHYVGQIVSILLPVALCVFQFFSQLLVCQFSFGISVSMSVNLSVSILRVRQFVSMLFEHNTEIIIYSPRDE